MSDTAPWQITQTIAPDTWTTVIGATPIEVMHDSSVGAINIATDAETGVVHFSPHQGVTWRVRLAKPRVSNAPDPFGAYAVDFNITMEGKGTAHADTQIVRPGQAAEARIYANSETGEIGQPVIEVFDVE
jgi:hypothetical protein